MLNSDNTRNTTNNNYSNIAVVLKFLAGLNTELKASGEAPFDAYFNGHSHYYGRAMETEDTGMGLGLGIPSFTIGDSGKVLDDIYPVSYGASLYNYQDDNGNNLSVTQLDDIYKHLGDTKPVSAGASGWTSNLIDTKQTLVGTAYKLSIPVYTDGQGQKIDATNATSDISGLYGYGSGAAEIKADKDYIFTHYKTVETLDPAIVRIAKEESKDYQRGSLFYERWSPTTARLEDLALFSFKVQVDKNHPTGYLTDFTMVNPGNGYFERSLNQATPVYDDYSVNFEINGNNPLIPLPSNISDPSRAVVRLSFKNGKLQPISPSDVINSGTDYRNLLNAIYEKNFDFTNIPDTGYPTEIEKEKRLLVGININLEAQTVFAEQASGKDLYHDWYLITDTTATASTSLGRFGSLNLALLPKAQDARDLIANTSLTTGYNSSGQQQKFDRAQSGALTVKDPITGLTIGAGTLSNGSATLSLTGLASSEALSIGFAGDPSSSYQINFKSSETTKTTNFIYRSYDPITGSHFYTSSPFENNLATTQNNYRFEQVEMLSKGDSAIYRFYNPAINDHFYTANPSEKNALITNSASGYQYEGIAFMGSQSSDPTMTAVHRLVNPLTNSHFYTSNTTEANLAMSTAGYRSEGIGWWF